eukprot:7394805-Karenia_brevis.AAC.1
MADICPQLNLHDPLVVYALDMSFCTFTGNSYHLTVSGASLLQIQKVHKKRKTPAGEHEQFSEDSDLSSCSEAPVKMYSTFSDISSSDADSILSA